MGRKKQNKIKKVNNRDRLAFQALAKGGTVSKSDLQTLLSKTRCENWKHINYFKEVNYTDNNNKRHEGYSLTLEGKKYAEERFGIVGFTKAKENTILHDLKIGEKIMSLSDKQQATVQTEDQLWERYHLEMEKRKELIEELEEKRLDLSLSEEERQEYAKKWVEEENDYNRIQEMYDNNEISVPDISYIQEDGTEIFYEIITPNYSELDKCAKVNFGRIFSVEVVFQSI